MRHAGDSHRKNLKKLRRQTIWLFLVAMVFAVLGMFWLDESVAHFFDEPQLHSFKVFCRRITDLGLGGPYFVAAAGLYAVSIVAIRLGKVRHGMHKTFDTLRSWSLMSFLSLTIVGLMILVLKLIFGRQRPHLTPDFQSLNFSPMNVHWDWQSFPSGHSQVILVVATCLSFLMPKHRWIVFSLAIFVAFTRVVTHQHFLSDVIIGATIGYLGTLWVREWFMTLKSGAPLRAIRRDH